MTGRQLAKRRRAKGLTLFAQGKIDREEYGAIIAGRGWVDHNRTLAIIPVWKRWARVATTPFRLIKRTLA